MRTEGRLLVPVAGLAIGIGLFVANASDAVLLATGLVVAAAGIAAILRRVLARVPRFSGLPTSQTHDDGRYQVPRGLLYAGLLTSCWLQLRIGGLTASDALFLLAVTWAIAEYVLTDSERTGVLTQSLWLGIGLFVVGGTISTIVNSTDKVSSAGVILRVFYLVAAWFWLGGMTLRTTEHVWRAVKLWVVSAAICGLWALGQKYVHLPGNLYHGRYAGLADHENDLGALAACAMVPALALAYRNPRWVFAVLGIAVGLALSGSIGGGIAALIALAFGLVSRDLTRVLAPALVVGAALIVLASPLVGASAITRFSTATNATAQYGQDTLYIRLRAYRAAWDRVTSDPLVGTGLDTKSSEILDQQTQTYYQVHNLFLGRWYDSGILGLLGVLVLVGGLGALGWRLIGNSPDRYLALVLFTAFIAYVVDEMSEPSLYKRYSLVPALLIVALNTITRRGSRQPPADEASVEDRGVLVAA